MNRASTSVDRDWNTLAPDPAHRAIVRTEVFRSRTTGGAYWTVISECEIGCIRFLTPRPVLILSMRSLRSRL